MIRIFTWVIAICVWAASASCVRSQEKDAAPEISKQQKQKVLVVVGAPGEETYRKQFLEWATLWEKNASAANCDFQLIGGKTKSKVERKQEDESEATDNVSDRSRLESYLKENVDHAGPMWIVLIGHGTFGGQGTAKFNLAGPDVTSSDLAKWIRPVKGQVVLVNCASASSPFLAEDWGKDRIVLTSTKSGFQYNFSRFGKFFAEAIVDRTIDLDKDGQTSLLEAFLAASNRTQEFYKSASRIATENALLDDNGDKLGTAADWFSGIRVTKQAKKGSIPDGPRANQVFFLASERNSKLPPEAIATRNELELQLERIRAERGNLSEEAYLNQLESVLFELAKIYEKHSK